MHLNKPITAQIEITDYCNFQCKHCYLLDSTKMQCVSRINSQNILKIAEILCAEKVFNVIITGGEPLAHPYLLRQIIDYLSKNNINVSVNTNLSLLTDDLIDFFKEKNIHNLLISCPSAVSSLFEEITNYHNFDHYLDNLKKVLKSSLNYSLNMVVTQINKHNIIDTALYLRKLGAKKFSATPMSLNPLYPRKDLLLSNEDVRILVEDLLWIRDNLGMAIDILEVLPKCVFPKEVLKQDLPFLKRKCQAGLNIIAISPNGDVRPCTHNPEVYGNILKDSLDDIWQRMSQWRTMEMIPIKCKNCKCFVSCHGGCRINAKAFYGKWDAEDVWTEEPICENLMPTISSELNLDIPVKVINLKFRKEGDYYLVCGNSSYQIAVINDEVCKLLDFINKQKKITLREIARLNNVGVDNDSFKDIITYLIRRGIIVYESSTNSIEL